MRGIDLATVRPWRWNLHTSTLMFVTEDEIIAAIQKRVAEGRPTSSSSALAPVYAPADETAVIELEDAIGYRLPPLLRRIYLEVANGGVGPFGGIDGVRGGMENMGPAAELYQEFHAEPLDPDMPPPPPAGVFFLCDFGCSVAALLDCRTPGGQMWWWDQGYRHKVDMSLHDWFVAWLEGRLEASASHDLMESLSLTDDESWCEAGCWCGRSEVDE